MRGLTKIERRILLPGPPGEGPFPDVAFQDLISLGRAYWKKDIEGTFFSPTPMGELALRVCLDE